MSHNNVCEEVNFFYLKNLNEDQLFYSAHNFRNSLFALTCSCCGNRYKPKNKNKITYDRFLDLCDQYTDIIFCHVKTLLIGISMVMYKNKGYMSTQNLTTLIFNKVLLINADRCAFMEFGMAYPNLKNVLYLDVDFSINFNKEILYTGFENLKRFRLDHYSISHRFLEDLLKFHPSLEIIVFDKLSGLTDTWIDVLMEQLKGRTVKSLSMHSSYFTNRRVNEFLRSDLVLDKSKINISKADDQITFSISII